MDAQPDMDAINAVVYYAKSKNDWYVKAVAKGRYTDAIKKAFEQLIKQGQFYGMTAETLTKFVIDDAKRLVLGFTQTNAQINVPRGLKSDRPVIEK